MYDRTVDVPRLLASYGEGDPAPHSVLDQAQICLGPPLSGRCPERTWRPIGLCLYRDGADSVAWHGDTIGRGATEDTLVAIVSLGWRRRLSLRPKQGGGTTAQLRRRWWRPTGDGRQLPAHLGARRSEDTAPGRTTDQCAVPSTGRAVADRRSSATSRLSDPLARDPKSVSTTLPPSTSTTATGPPASPWRTRRSYRPLASESKSAAQIGPSGSTRSRTAVWTPSHSPPSRRISISDPSSDAGVRTIAAPTSPPMSRTAPPASLGPSAVLHRPRVRRTPASWPGSSSHCGERRDTGSSRGDAAFPWP